ncbi:MAG: S9 family peptidase, partial [Gemmatimonadetes bacterium]|nr:S9 family peptidase [Gemmatimonadota bacterium]
MKLSSVARRWLFTGTLAALVAMPLQAQESDTEAVYRTPPPELAALVDAPPAPGVSLGPDGRTLLIMTRPGAPSIAEVSAPELRLAGLRINPRNNGPSRGATMIRLAFQSLDGDERPVTGVPDAPRIADVRWSPDGAHVAFSLRMDEHIELWVADAASGEARKLMDPALNAAYFGSPFGWVSDGQSLLARTIPADRGPAPAEAAVPTGPVIQETTGEAAPNRTYQDLLQNPHDERVFEYYATSQLVRVDLDGNVTPMGDPDLIRGVSPSPEGTFALVQTTHRPYSYLVPASRFPNRIEVWDMDGTVVSEIADLPLQDKVPTGFGSVPTGVRSISWRADAPATLVWT